MVPWCCCRPHQTRSTSYHWSAASQLSCSLWIFHWAPEQHLKPDYTVRNRNKNINTIPGLSCCPLNLRRAKRRMFHCTGLWWSGDLVKSVVLTPISFVVLHSKDTKTQKEARNYQVSGCCGCVWGNRWWCCKSEIPSKVWKSEQSIIYHESISKQKPCRNEISVKVWSGFYKQAFYYFYLHTATIQRKILYFLLNKTQ